MNANPTIRRRWMRATSLVAVAFGLLTLKEGGSVLFGSAAARAAAGAYVPFVLWFNFGAGFAYVVAGLGMGLRQRWAAPLAALIAAATALTFAALGVHIAQGGRFRDAHRGRHGAAHHGLGRAGLAGLQAPGPPT